MSISFETLGNELIGKYHKFRTPYGERILTYADYTASGRGLSFIERYLLEVQKSYANTHTEDDMTGEVMTNILSKAVNIIKKQLNAENNCYVIPAGSGTTGAIECFAKITGVYIPPAAKVRLDNILKEYIKDVGSISDIIKKSNVSSEYIPVIFTGPYEHHSNILIWREGIAEVVEIGLREDGTFDTGDLKRKLTDERYKNRPKIGSFSAASNVTGILSPIYEIVEILHENNALACFDFAACAPYIDINMNKSDKEYFDAVFFSPHKFLGGPGSSGILVINKEVYDNTIPPTVSGGGTVEYVSSFAQDYIQEAEEREMSGTPGIMQIIRAALVIELKNLVGIKNIESIEKYYTEKAFNRLHSNPNIKILGPTDINDRLPIFSIMIRYKDKFIHPRFAAQLLNDLFGIQTRAGCACAGPYGHRLLEINNENSLIYRRLIDKGISSVKPGWLRFNLHYIMEENEVEFILQAIEFVAEYGFLFLDDYILDIESGKWKHKEYSGSYIIADHFGIEESLRFLKARSYNSADEKKYMPDEYKKYFDEAKIYANRIIKRPRQELRTLDEEKYCGKGWFYFINSNIST